MIIFTFLCCSMGRKMNQSKANVRFIEVKVIQIMRLNQTSHSDCMKWKNCRSFILADGSSYIILSCWGFWCRMCISKWGCVFLRKQCAQISPVSNERIKIWFGILCLSMKLPSVPAVHILCHKWKTCLLFFILALKLKNKTCINYYRTEKNVWLANSLLFLILPLAKSGSLSALYLNWASPNIITQTTVGGYQCCSHPTDPMATSQDVSALYWRPEGILVFLV